MTKEDKQLLKNLPKWKKDEGSCIVESPRLAIWYYEGEKHYTLLFKGAMYVEGTEYLSIDELEKLPRE